MELSTNLFWTLLFSAIYFFYCDEDDDTLKPRDVPQNELENVYDFIIVGAGTAGCALASRLTENANWTVLLIEAGGDETPITDIPFLSITLPNTEVDWNYTTVPQKEACLSKGGICQYNLGHVMGGSSTINDLFLVRGNNRDYDNWEKLGNTGWSYNETLPYFIKAENVSAEPRLALSSYHGTDGPLHIQYAKYRTPLRAEYIKACEEFGLINRDYNGEIQENSVDYPQFTLDGPSRDSASKAYLNPIRDRPNLNVIKKSNVVNILIDKKNTLVTGVEYIRNKKKYSIKSRKEVILSAGAINTPKLLMLSGIGLKSDLRKFNIKVIANLPVGKNFQDHVQVKLNFEINKNVTITSNVWKTPESILTYAEDRGGPLSTTALGAAAFVNKNNSKVSSIIAYQLINTGQTSLESQNKQLIGVTVSLFNPLSTGSVKLKNKNSETSPLIDPNFFSISSDYEIFYKGIKCVFDIMNTTIMKKYSPTLSTKEQSKCSGLDTEKYITCLIKQYSFPSSHPVGTVKMGPENDTNAVVTPDLIVKGFKNLRVVDASIMPVIPAANTYSPTFMIAEKAADMIKNTTYF